MQQEVRNVTQAVGVAVGELRKDVWLLGRDPAEAPTKVNCSILHLKKVSTKLTTRQWKPILRFYYQS